jgi:hypothetical protein
MPVCRKHRPAYGRSAAAVSVGGSYLAQRCVSELKRALVVQRAVHCVLLAGPDVPRSGFAGRSQIGCRFCVGRCEAGQYHVKLRLVRSSQVSLGMGGPTTRSP